MDLHTSWTVARKDLMVFRRKRAILVGLVMFPLFVSIGLPGVCWLVVQRNSTLQFSDLTQLFDAFLFFFMIGTTALPTAMASYSVAGEKIEKSLEPLLATPATDSEILLGKTMAAFIPTMVSTYIGAMVYMALIDAMSFQNLGYLYFPNWAVVVFLLIGAPLACLLSVEASIIFSASATDVRSAQQLSSLVILPFAAIYVATEINVITLDTNTMLDLSAILALADLGLFYVSTATFRREEILTKWK